MYKLSVIGNLCADAKTGVDKNGRDFISFRMGASHRGQSMFFGVLYYGHPAILDYLVKGRMVYVDGSFGVCASENAEYPEPQITIFANTVELLGRGDRERLPEVAEKPAQTSRRYSKSGR